MQTFEIGKKFPIGLASEGALLNVDNSGLQVICNFYEPTEQDIAAFKAKSPLTIHMGKINDLLVWVVDTLSFSFDCTYSPAAAKKRPFMQPISEGFGYNTMFFMVDASTNRLVAMRMIGLSSDFSKELKKIIEGIDINPSKYRYSIDKFYRKYPTADSIKKDLPFTYSI